MIALKEERLKPGQLIAHQEINHLAGLEAAIDIIAEHDEVWRRFTIARVFLNALEQGLQQVRAAMHVTNRVNEYTVRKLCRRRLRGRI